MEKRQMEQDYSKHSKEGGGGISVRRTTDRECQKEQGQDFRWGFDRDRCGGGREVFLVQQTRWVGGQQENEENHRPRIQED